MSNEQEQDMKKVIERGRILNRIRMHKDDLERLKDDFRNEVLELHNWVSDKSNNISGHGINDSMEEMQRILGEIKKEEAILKELEEINVLCHY